MILLNQTIPVELEVQCAVVQWCSGVCRGVECGWVWEARRARIQCPADICANRPRSRVTLHGTRQHARRTHRNVAAARYRWVATTQHYTYLSLINNTYCKVTEFGEAERLKVLVTTVKVHIIYSKCIKINRYLLTIKLSMYLYYLVQQEIRSYLGTCIYYFIQHAT